MLVRFGRLMIISVFDVGLITTAPVGGTARTAIGLASASETNHCKGILQQRIAKLC
jgi:hypothetical protein